MVQLERHAYKIIGMLFLFFSGAFYTAERIAARIAEGIAAAGGDGSKHPSEVYWHPSITDNFFVWFFLLIGFVILAYGFPRRGER